LFNLGADKSDDSEVGAEAFSVTPFNRLARTHAASVAGDTLLTIALANSLFFEVDPNGARWRIGLYLVFTIAPFAIVAPFLGPLMDKFKGGHRWMIVVTAVIRALLMASLMFYVKTLILFPLAFSMLVMGKTYAVAKSSVVPTTVSDSQELVKTNSRLTVLAAIAGVVAGGVGVALLKVANESWTLGLGAIIFCVCAALALQIPSYEDSLEEPDSDQLIELKSASIRMGSIAMGFIRSGVGFVTMLLAFSLRGGIDPGPVGPGVELGHRVREALGSERLILSSGGSPPWHFGVALAGAGLGGLIGAVGVPKLREAIREEKIIAASLFSLAIIATLAAIQQVNYVGAFLMGFGVTLAAQGGKQAFDSMIQRDAPIENLGRTFSGFESRFQLYWVLGALIPVIFNLPANVGYLMIAGAASMVLVLYWLGKAPVINFRRRAKPKSEELVEPETNNEVELNISE